MSSDRGVCFTRSSQMFNAISVFSARAIISSSFLSIWLRSFVPAKNAWNAVTLAWKLLCVAFADFSLSSQQNRKPFSVIVLERVSDVLPFLGVARAVFSAWSVKCALCARVSLNPVLLVPSWVFGVSPGFVFYWAFWELSMAKRLYFSQEAGQSDDTETL